MLQREETKFLRFVALLRFKYIRVYVHLGCTQTNLFYKY